ncbi:hypothetical protein BDQ12DRAFT_612028 [Crucibulum laeve]|uniref:Uncharacterized protein n=1 Tax=Crucibulum laeve TaxID=68775 RepID=A0A5C3LQ93_9AGAR|nr:hypothetical protein BDQ12DRAFT_612028 [Crucibulum laeve]
MQKEWKSPIYAFFHPTPVVGYVNNCCMHEFRCAATHWKGQSQIVCCYLDTADKTSTSNMVKHAIVCWGQETVSSAREAGMQQDLFLLSSRYLGRQWVKTAIFERSGKGKVSYSHRQHTGHKTSLMKTGRPDRCLGQQHCESAAGVSDTDIIHTILTHHACLQDYSSSISFGTDPWISPNHKAYIAITAHFEQDGLPISLLLNIVEVAHLHSGLNLAAAFAKVLDDFSISDEVIQFSLW